MLGSPLGPLGLLLGGGRWRKGRGRWREGGRRWRPQPLPGQAIRHQACQASERRRHPALPLKLPTSPARAAHSAYPVSPAPPPAPSARASATPPPPLGPPPPQGPSPLGLPRGPKAPPPNDRGCSGEGYGETSRMAIPRNNFPVYAPGKKSIALGLATSDSSTSSHRSRAAAEARGLREVEARGLEALPVARGHNGWWRRGHSVGVPTMGVLPS